MPPNLWHSTRTCIRHKNTHQTQGHASDTRRCITVHSELGVAQEHASECISISSMCISNAVPSDQGVAHEQASECRRVSRQIHPHTSSLQSVCISIREYGNYPLYCRNDEAARTLLPRIVCKGLAYMLEVLIEAPLLHTFTACTQASHECSTLLSNIEHPSTSTSTPPHTRVDTDTHGQTRTHTRKYTHADTSASLLECGGAPGVCAGVLASRFGSKRSDNSGSALMSMPLRSVSRST